MAAVIACRKRSLNAMARGISLREFTIEDADAVHRWFNSPAATANLLEHRDEFGEEDARRWVERAIEQAGDPDSEDRKWAIEVEGIVEPVGYGPLRPPPPDRARSSARSSATTGCGGWGSGGRPSGSPT